MKILNVIHILNPKSGGPVAQVSSISQKLAERGHEVTILTTDFLFDQEYARKIKNVEVIPVRSVFSIGGFIYSPEIASFLSTRIKDFDIIHLQSFRSYQNAMVMKHAKKIGIPYILQAHGSVLPFFQKQLLKKVFDMTWGNKILKNALKCIALTKTESDQYIKMGVPEEKIVIIPNGLDLSQFSNLPERGTFRKKYGISDNKQIILFLGRIHKIKGIDLLIDAYSQVIEELPHARLVIAGPDGGYLSTIQEQIQQLNLGNPPLITGPLYDRDKLEAYVDADVYVLPSIYEAFPITVLEAWACGTPVIVTDSCAISLVAQHAGLVVKRDPIELAKAIKRLMIDKSLREECSKNGELLVNNEFNLESAITKIEECYRQVI